MASVKQKNTAEEIAVQKYLDNLGIIFEKHPVDLPGSPDIVNRTDKWVIFVNGCFWHGHNCQKKRPETNAEYWNNKIKENQERDKKNLIDLLNIGYSILVLWGCEIKKGELSKIDKFLNPIFEEYIFDKNNKKVKRIVKTQKKQLSINELCIDNLKWCHDTREAFDYAYLRSEKQIQPIYDETILCVDLFSGCGGLSLGALEACHALHKNFLALLALDIEKDPLKIYKKNIPVKETYEADIQTVLDGEIGSPPTSSEKGLLKKVHGAQLLLAGPPCQDHSSLNNYKSTESKKNALYQKIARYVELQKPDHIIIENVPNVINDKKNFAKNTISEIEKFNYFVDSATVDFSRIGIPQNRKRHIVVASKTKIFSIEKILRKYETILPRSAGWAIDDLQNELSMNAFSTPSKMSPSNVHRIEFLFKNDVYDLPNRERPLCHRGNHSYVSMYGRLKPDEPAQTITSGFKSPGQGRYIHYNQKRALTPHEAARLQFFPDFFEFNEVNQGTSLAKIIGNAVSMKLAYILGLELLY